LAVGKDFACERRRIGNAEPSGRVVNPIDRKKKIAVWREASGANGRCAEHRLAAAVFVLR
jgi:hypothetical protein